MKCNNPPGRGCRDLAVGEGVAREVSLALLRLVEPGSKVPARRSDKY